MSADLSSPPPTVTPVVRARPQKLRLICTALSVAMLVIFGTVAAVLRSSSDGVTFHLSDQIAVAGIGVALAGLFWLPSRPRMVADHEGVRVRGLVGELKLVPWSVIQAIEFRPKWRWARLVLPADETISLYAVQRLDGARAVATMRALRALEDSVRDGPTRPRSAQ